MKWTERSSMDLNVPVRKLTLDPDGITGVFHQDFRCEFPNRNRLGGQ